MPPAPSGAAGRNGTGRISKVESHTNPKPCGKFCNTLEPCTQILPAIFHWLQTNEQSLAIWLEGLALVAIFGLELADTRDRSANGKPSTKNPSLRCRSPETRLPPPEMRRLPPKPAPTLSSTASGLGLKSVWNRREKDPWDTEDDEENENTVFFVCSIQIKNHGRTLARVESVQIRRGYR